MKLIVVLTTLDEERLSRAALWREARDRALAAIFLGGGLKVAEASTLELRTVDVGQTWIIIESENGKYSRRLQMLDSLKPLLLEWLTIRRDAKTQGTLVFPATSKGDLMHKATILRAVDALVDRADLRRGAETKISPQILRNTYAAILFDEGQTPELVGERLGLALPRSAHRLLAAWEAWQAAHHHLRRS